MSKHTINTGANKAENTPNAQQNEVILAANIHAGMARQGHQEDSYLICPDLSAPNWGQMRQAGSGMMATGIRSIEPETLLEAVADFAPIERPYIMGDRFYYGDKGYLLVVADGMGGMNAGEVASRLAVEGVREYFNTKITAGGDWDKTAPKTLLTECILYAHQKIMDYAQQNPNTSGMGTTVVVAWIKNAELHVGWSGDSRCYLQRQKKLTQINKDHSYVQSLVAQRKITMREAFDHPQKHIVTQSLGDAEHPPAPDHSYVPLLPGDRILLCSDGLNTMLYDDAIQQLLNDHTDTVDASLHLVAEANKAGGFDNITVIVADVNTLAGATAAPPALMTAAQAGAPTASIKSKWFSMKNLIMLALLFLMVAVTYFVFSGVGNEKDDEDKTGQPNQLSLTLDTSKNEIKAKAIGGVRPYKYSLNNLAYQNDSTFKNLKNGNYRVTVKDDNNNTATVTVSMNHRVSELGAPIPPETEPDKPKSTSPSGGTDNSAGFPLAVYLQDLLKVINSLSTQESECKEALDVLYAQMEKCTDINNSQCAKALLCKADPNCGNIAVLKRKYGCNVAAQGNVEFRSTAEEDVEAQVLALAEMLHKKNKIPPYKRGEILFAGVSIGATKTLASAKWQRGQERIINKIKGIILVYNPNSEWKYLLVLEAKNAKDADDLVNEYKARGAQKIMYRRITQGRDSWYQETSI